MRLPAWERPAIDHHSGSQFGNVRQPFTQFQENLLLTPAQRTDGMTKRAGVVSCLNSAYYNSNSQTDNSFFVGSWARIRPSGHLAM